MIKRIDRADGPKFQVYAQRGGRKVYVGTFASRREAAEAEEDYRVTQRKVERGELPEQMDLNRTLAAAVADWLEMLDKAGSRSHGTYGEFMKAQVLPRLGTVQLARLTKVHVATWRDELVGAYSPRTINSALGCLSSACRSFVERGWLAANPCRGVKPLKVPKRAYEWIRTVPEIERLLRSCDGDFRDLVGVALGTGMRVDEILHLHWDDVDLAGRLITVQRGRQGTTKSGEARQVPILDATLAVLQARALRRGGAVLVFPSRTGKVRAKPHVNTTFRAAVRRAELSERLRFHDLRHTFASHWVMNGGDIFRLSKVLGHKDVRITQQTYAHLAPEAWAQDYHRVSFRMPSEARVFEFPRDERGRLLGKRGVVA